MLAAEWRTCIFVFYDTTFPSLDDLWSCLDLEFTVWCWDQCPCFFHPKLFGVIHILRRPLVSCFQLPLPLSSSTSVYSYPSSKHFQILQVLSKYFMVILHWATFYRISKSNCLHQHPWPLESMALYYSRLLTDNPHQHVEYITISIHRMYCYYNTKFSILFTVLVQKPPKMCH